MKITVYTDGACSGNPGIGGWGAVILIEDTKPVHLHGGSDHTTNNQMELTAAIEALKYFSESSTLNFFTDSKYVKEGIESWVHNWKKNGWILIFLQIASTLKKELSHGYITGKKMDGKRLQKNLSKIKNYGRNLMHK